MDSKLAQFNSAIKKEKPEFIAGKTGFELLSNAFESNTTYYLINGQKSFVPNLRDYDPQTRVTIIDGNKRKETIRYLRDCPSFIQSEQVEKYKRPANEQYDPTNRKELLFKKGFCFPETQEAFDYLWELPQHDLYPSEYRASDVTAIYKLYEPEIIKQENTNTVLLQRKCLNYLVEIMDADNGYKNLNKEAVKTFHIALFGSHDAMPESNNDLFNKFVYKCDVNINESSEIVLLVDKFSKSKKVENKVEEKKESVLVDEQKKVELKIEEEIEQILGRAIQEKIISYTDNQNEVGILNKFKKYTKCYSNEQSSSTEELHSLFSSYLLTKEGEQILETIKKQIKWGVQTGVAEVPPQT